jgi:hypothetical protein
LIHYECLNLLMVLYSTSLYSGSLYSNSRKHNIFLEATMQIRNSYMINGVIKYLLTNVTNYRVRKDGMEWNGGQP